MLNREFLEKLTPVEIQMISEYINALFKRKVTLNTSNSENLEGSLERCPYCGGHHFVKNGKDKKTRRQKYFCKDCGKFFAASKDTFFYHSRIGYNTWMTFIACEVQCLSLKAESDITGVSKTTCFNMRHKLYDALRDEYKKDKQNGIVEIDAAYTSINLKGMKNGMPRISKKRGKHKPDPKHKSLRGISHHKICLITSIDENDDMLFHIAGLGPESLEKYQQFHGQFSRGCKLVCDEKSCIQTFARNNRLQYDVIPAGHFKSAAGNTLSSVNQLHQEFKELIRKKRGVSTRHLQGYMDWLVMTKQLKYRIEGGKKMDTQIYMNIMNNPSSFTTDMTCKLPFPIDLYEAYCEYGMITKNQSLS
jgi:transposase-like protein